MNRRGQLEEIVGLFFEFLIIFFVVGALGAAIYPMTYNIPFGALFRILLPSPEDVALNFIKQFLWAIAGTGGTAAAIFR